jgi:uncharacterized protein YcnI
VGQHRRAVTVATGVAAFAGLGFIFAGQALAHVTADAPGATQGGYATITFKVPTESDTAATVGLKVQLPTDNPIASVSIQPKAGWTYTVKKAKPATPLSNDDGPITEIITEIDWKAAAGSPGIKPGEFDDFVISGGPMPKVDAVTFKAVQTYSDGKVVSWIETPASGSSAEPAHPAPTIALAAATGSADNHATPSASPSATAVDHNANEQDGTNGLSVAAFIVGVLGLLLAIVAFFWILTVGTKLGKGSSKT